MSVDCQFLVESDPRDGFGSTAEAPSGSGPPKPGEGPPKPDSMQVSIEPRAMWKQECHEAWRNERDLQNENPLSSRRTRTITRTTD